MFYCSVVKESFRTKRLDSVFRSCVDRTAGGVHMLSFNKGRGLTQNFVCFSSKLLPAAILELTLKRTSTSIIVLLHNEPTLGT
ncbi:hypothetical protein J6590_084233 [Homalodisca vitripennis]|nr:hypothetical protein J6590_084233 [Homalodisca vitripennis]